MTPQAAADKAFKRTDETLPNIRSMFLKYSIEPKVLAGYLKAGLGRFLPTHQRARPRATLAYRATV